MPASCPGGRPPPPPALDPGLRRPRGEIRWMLEELRVSYFAPGAGDRARRAVSELRVACPRSIGAGRTHSWWTTGHGGTTDGPHDPGWLPCRASRWPVPAAGSTSEPLDQPRSTAGRGPLVRGGRCGRPRRGAGVPAGGHHPAARLPLVRSQRGLPDHLPRRERSPRRRRGPRRPSGAGMICSAWSPPRSSRSACRARPGPPRCGSPSRATHRQLFGKLYARSHMRRTAGTSSAGSCCTAAWRTRSRSTPSAGWSAGGLRAVADAAPGRPATPRVRGAAGATPEREYPGWSVTAACC